MAPQPHDELALVESPEYANVTWAPHIVEAASRQRAEIIELSHAARAPEFDELDDHDWALIEQAAGEIEDVAIALAHEREIDDQFARMGPSVLELAYPIEETTDMAYIPDFGAYDRSASTSTTYEDPLDRAARNKATYGYDPDEFDVQEPDEPIVNDLDGAIQRMDWMEQVHKENPLLDLASAKHRRGSETGAAPRKPWLIQGRVNADGVATFEDGTPITDRYGQTYAAVDTTSARAEAKSDADRRKLDGMKPDAFRDSWQQQFRGAFK